LEILGEKEKVLSRLDDSILLELAKAVSENQIGRGTSRDDLVKVIKSCLSIEEIKQKVGEMKNYGSLRSAIRGINARRRGFRFGSAASIISGIIILLLLIMPIYCFNHVVDLTSGTSITFSTGDFYATGYDLAFGFVMFPGLETSWVEPIAQSPVIWLIIITSMATVVFGDISGPELGGKSRSRKMLVDHSGTLIVIMGLALFLLSCIALEDLSYTVQLVLWPYEYSGNVVFSTVDALMVMGGIVFFSGLEVRRESSS
jgi:hypothetical protein